MKILSLITICFCLFGCPTYDPPSGFIEIFNATDSTVYVYLTCSDDIPCDSPLPRFMTFSDDSTDSTGRIMKDTIFLNYRLAPNSESSLRVGGTPKKPKVQCDENALKIFIIDDYIMSTKTWEEICANDLYRKKVILTQNQLDSLDWKVKI